MKFRKSVNYSMMMIHLKRPLRRWWNLINTREMVKLNMRKVLRAFRFSISDPLFVNDSFMQFFTLTDREKCFPLFL